MERIVHGGDVYGGNAGLLDFSVCLNPAGAPKAVLRAAQEGVLRQGYPDPQCRGLVRAAAQRDGVEEDMVLWGNGCADLIDRFSLSLRPKKAILLAPTFGEYRRALEGVGCQIEEVHLSWENGFVPDGTLLEAIVPGVELVFLCDPNNPTGLALSPEALESFLERVPAHCVVVLDEAYCHYLPENLRADSVAWVRRFPNLMVTRTFSKAYGLAGLRAGFGVAQAPLIEMMNRIRPPFNMNSLAQAAACAAIDDEAFLKTVYEANRAGLATFEALFTRLGLTFIPSTANFMLVRVGDKAARINTELLKRGVIVRPVTSYGLPEWLRISVGSSAENARFAEAFEEALKAVA